MDLPEHDDVPLGSRQVRDEETDRDSDTESVAERQGVYSGGLDRLERKLRDLKAARAEINRDIAMLEGALGIVDDNSG
jgi:LDH2 family malate/lactate/ureidoglycolate dehydrogenase